MFDCVYTVSSSSPMMRYDMRNVLYSVIIAAGCIVHQCRSKDSKKIGETEQAETSGEAESPGGDWSLTLSSPKIKWVSFLHHPPFTTMCSDPHGSDNRH